MNSNDQLEIFQNKLSKLTYMTTDQIIYNSLSNSHYRDGQESYSISYILDIQSYGLHLDLLQHTILDTYITIINSVVPNINIKATQKIFSEIIEFAHCFLSQPSFANIITTKVNSKMSYITLIITNSKYPIIAMPRVIYFERPNNDSEFIPPICITKLGSNKHLFDYLIDLDKSIDKNKIECLYNQYSDYMINKFENMKNKTVGLTDNKTDINAQAFILTPTAFISDKSFWNEHCSYVNAFTYDIKDSSTDQQLFIDRHPAILNMLANKIEGVNNVVS